MSWASLEKGLATSRSRATISRSRSAASSSGSGVSRFMPATSSGTDRATTKSAPCRRNAATGPGAPGLTRAITCRMLRPVRSGFCSDPDRANSFSMMAWVRTNQEWSCPVARRWASVPRVSKPGKSGAGNRRPTASNHIDEGPGRMRMPWPGQTGSQFRSPST